MRGFGILLALAAALAAPAGAQGLFDDNEARRRVDELRKQVEAVNARLARMEADAVERRAILDLAGQIEALRADLSRMRGQVEVLLNQLETGEKRQKDLYLDIDTRLRKLEQVKETAEKPPAEAAVPSAETKLYESALNQFKAGNYPVAISVFQSLLVTYPSSKHAPNAQYWIGMAHTAQRDYKQAIVAHQKVLAAWPDDPKAPDALLNIASSQEAIGDRRGAQKTLDAIIARYPASPAAASAKQRRQSK